MASFNTWSTVPSLSKQFVQEFTLCSDIPIKANITSGQIECPPGTRLYFPKSRPHPQSPLLFHQLLFQTRSRLQWRVSIESCTCAVQAGKSIATARAFHNRDVGATFKYNWLSFSSSILSALALLPALQNAAGLSEFFLPCRRLQRPRSWLNTQSSSTLKVGTCNIDKNCHKVPHGVEERPAEAKAAVYT